MSLLDQQGNELIKGTPESRYLSTISIYAGGFVTIVVKPSVFDDIGALSRMIRATAIMDGQQQGKTQQSIEVYPAVIMIGLIVVPHESYKRQC
jgi:hypothetical protein